MTTHLETDRLRDLAREGEQFDPNQLSPSALSTAGRNARLNQKKLEEIRAREISHVDNESLKVTD